MYTAPVFESPDEHVEEVDEGELDERSEYGHEADDDEDVQCGGVPHLYSACSTVQYSTVQ